MPSALALVEAHDELHQRNAEGWLTLGALAAIVYFGAKALAPRQASPAPAPALSPAALAPSPAPYVSRWSAINSGGYSGGSCLPDSAEVQLFGGSYGMKPATPVPPPDTRGRANPFLQGPMPGWRYTGPPDTISIDAEATRCRAAQANGYLNAADQAYQQARQGTWMNSAL